MTSSRPSRPARHRLAQAFVLLLFFLLGYNTVAAQYQACGAQALTPFTPINPGAVSGVGVAVCGCEDPVPCVPPGTADRAMQAMGQSLQAALEDSALIVEKAAAEMVDTLVETVLTRLEQVETDLIAWFDTYWFYNYRPSLQAATEQTNIADFEQAQAHAAMRDAEEQAKSLIAQQTAQIASARAAADVSGDETCAVATASGGVGRANVFSRAMRRAWQRDNSARMMNEAGSPAATGAAALIAAQSQTFEELFCDPRDNNGRNKCGASDPALYNADVQVTARVYNVLTIPMHEDDRYNTAVETMIDNLAGRTLANTMTPSALKTAAGKEEWMLRRSYAARKNAVRSVPELVTSWRVPGSGIGNFTAALREGAGVTLDNLSSNPSYREILHAMTIDRFNSGSYALEKMGGEERQQMENLVLSAMYLVQLRDYFELLERTALTLAVQVAVLAEGNQGGKK